MSRLILAGLLALASGVTATAARAENPFGLEVAGWSSRQAPTGTVYFSCQQAACGGEQGLISISRRAPMPDMTLERFKATQIAINSQILARVPGIRASTLGSAMMAPAKSVLIFTMPRDQVVASGEERFFLVALLVGPSGTLSVLSDGPSRKIADGNFRLFLPRLIQLAESLR